jgi:propanol-preferring alcohol dehydrogenase
MMRAMQLIEAGKPLRLVSREIGRPGPGQVLLRVSACGVCRTDLHIVDGELPALDHPIIPGHEVVGTVVEEGPGSGRFKPGERVGVPWLGWTCGACRYCTTGRENFCDEARFTGYHLETAATPSTQSPTAATVLRCRAASATRKRRRCCAPD